MEKQAAQLQSIQILYECDGEVIEYSVYPFNLEAEVTAEERVVLYCTVLCDNCNEFHRFSFFEGFDFPL